MNRILISSSGRASQFLFIILQHLQRCEDPCWLCGWLGISSGKMASPFVPVPVPMDRALSGGSGKLRRPQRASSLGSVSSSSSCSSITRTAGEDQRSGSRCSQRQSRCSRSRTPPPHQSPVTRARVNGSLEPSVEYSSCPRSISDPVGSQQEGDRPITPTVLGYEVMEERAKFTVRISAHIKSWQTYETGMNSFLF